MPLRAFAGPVLLIALTLILPAFLGRGVLKKDYFDHAFVEKLEQERPEVLLIGNSMLITRLDRERVRELAGDIRVSDLSNGGTASAAWYLFFKNVALALPAPPHTVVVFFRDNVLTRPASRTTGPHFEFFRGLMHGTDPEVAAVLGLSSESLHVKGLPHRMFPIIEDRGYIRQRLTLFSQDLATGTGSKYPLMDARRRIFGLDNLRMDLPSELIDSGSLRFDPAGTFLPLFIDLAREHGVRLVFYRIKRRPAPDGVRLQSPDLESYIAELEAWLEQHGVVFIDETSDPELGVELYRDGDHLYSASRRRWTELFWDRLAPIIEAPRSEESARR